MTRRRGPGQAGNGPLLGKDQVFQVLAHRLGIPEIVMRLDQGVKDRLLWGAANLPDRQGSVVKRSPGGRPGGGPVPGLGLMLMEENGKITLTVKDKQVDLTKEFINFEVQEKMVQEEKFTPSVIEPSYGIGRIVYCIFEHCFKVRPDNA